jgi:hypothetical protein
MVDGWYMYHVLLLLPLSPSLSGIYWNEIILVAEIIRIQQNNLTVLNTLYILVEGKDSA